MVNKRDAIRQVEFVHSTLLVSYSNTNVEIILTHLDLVCPQRLINALTSELRLATNAAHCK